MPFPYAKEIEFIGTYERLPDATESEMTASEFLTVMLLSGLQRNDRGSDHWAPERGSAYGVNGNASPFSPSAAAQLKNNTGDMSPDRIAYWYATGFNAWWRQEPPTQPTLPD